MLFFNKKKRTEDKPQVAVTIEKEGEKVVGVRQSHNAVRKSTDNLGFLKRNSASTGYPVFDGKVEHAYESDFLGYKDKCPRCESSTIQMLSNFPYATSTLPRILAGPAGHFCQHCPTVIIDDDVMRMGIKDLSIEYLGVVSIETGYTDDPILFSTMNGEKSLYILSDFDQVDGIAQSVHGSSFPGVFDFIEEDQSAAPAKAKALLKKRKKNKAARKARKKNRRRR